MNETICCSTKHKCLMELQFSDCKLNPSSENEPHLYLQKDANYKVIMWSAMLALQVPFTAKFIVISQHLEIL